MAEQLPVVKPNGDEGLRLMLSNDGVSQHTMLAEVSRPILPRAVTETPRLPSGRAINQIIDALKSDNSPEGFLPAGENMLMAAADEFTGALGVEAIRVARARHATAVDRQDVQEADRKLRHNEAAERRAWCLGLGGVAGGAAAAAAVAVAMSPTPVRHASYWWLIIAVLCTVAVGLISTSYPRGNQRV